MASRLAQLRRLSLGLQALGFMLLVLVSWLDETLDLPHLLFHAAATPFRPEEALFETLVLVIVGVLSLFLTSHLLKGLIQARSFLPFCPSCQRVRRGERWTSVTDFLQEEQADLLGYGLCPACASRMQEPKPRSD
jgi:hypothetical protein